MDRLTGNDDYTIGSFRTIEGSRRRILQYGNLLHFIDVKVVEVLHGNLCTIKYDCRLVDLLPAVRERTHTTQHQLGSVVRVRTLGSILHHSHTRSKGRDSTNKIGTRYLSKFQSRHLSYRTCKCFLVFSNKTCYNNIAQCIGILLQLYMHGTEFLRF